MNEKTQKRLIWAVALSESSHIVCCVFPTLFSVVGLLASAGMVIALPPAMIDLHEFMHEWEVPMIAVSGIILVLAWGAVLYSDKVDCHSTGCGHGACAPRKKSAHTILKIASALFVVNVLVYIFLHSGVL